MSRPSTTIPPSPITSRCSSRSRARTAGTTLTGDTAALTSSEPDRDARRRRRRPMIVGRERVGAGHDLGLPARAATASGSCTSTPCAQHPPGHRAEHGPGVEVAQPEPRGDAARRTRLARSGRAVDGDDDVRWGAAHVALPSVPGSAGSADGRPQPTGGSPTRETPGRPGGAPRGSPSTTSSTRPTGRPGSWSMWMSSMLTSLAPASAKSRASSPGWSGTDTNTDRGRPGRAAVLARDRAGAGHAPVEQGTEPGRASRRRQRRSSRPARRGPRPAGRRRPRRSRPRSAPTSRGRCRRRG